MGKVAITGAAGFTGTYLSKMLRDEGHEIHGLVHSADDQLEPGFHRHICDLADEQSLTDALQRIRPDKIVHLAAISFVAHGNIEDIYRTNVIGSRNLLQAAVKSKHTSSAILMASSANIYGNQTEGVLTEDSPARPVNDYAVSKIAMEYVCRTYMDRLPIIIARPFNYTGVGQSKNFLIPKIVDHIRRRASEIELGNLDVARDFWDVRAVVSSYAGLLKQAEAIGGTFNICSGQAHSLRDVMDKAQAIAGHFMEIKVNPDFVRANEVKTLIGDRARLDALFPNLPNFAIEETLRWMIEA